MAMTPNDPEDERLILSNVEPDRVLIDFDHNTGHLRLICGEKAYARLRDLVWKEADLGVIINIPSAPIRSMCLELTPESNVPPLTGWANRFALIGCVVLLMSVSVIFLIGVWTIGNWVITTN